MTVLMIALTEARSNWRRNLVIVAILVIAAATQLFTAVSGVATTRALDTYGTEVFGRAETYAASLSDEPRRVNLVALDDEFTRIRQAHGWFRPSITARVSVSARDGDDPMLTPLDLLAVDGRWREVTAARFTDEVWRTVTSPQRRWPEILLDRDTQLWAEQRTPFEVRLLLPMEGDSAGLDAGEFTARHEEVTGVLVRDRFTEGNKSYKSDGITGLATVSQLGLPAQSPTVSWVCRDGERCEDTRRLVSTAVESLGGRLGEVRRIDDRSAIQPMLDQQLTEGRRLRLVVLVLAVASIALLGTAFVEVRAPQLNILRTLGASRAAIGVIVLTETFACAVAAAAVVSVFGGWLVNADPNRFNAIETVVLSDLGFPTDAFARAALITLATGVVAGLVPAVRAYRGVRTR